MAEFDCKKCLHEKVCALWASRESQDASCFCTDGCDYFTPTLTPPNEPLTLEELREMDGEPVWVDDEKTWAILQVWDDQNIDAVFPIQRGCFRAESVLGMKIYRRPPEGEEYT